MIELLRGLLTDWGSRRSEVHERRNGRDDRNYSIERIENLLEAHHQDLMGLRSQRVAHVTSTEPVDRPRLERAIEQLYSQAEIKVPDLPVIWFGSPCELIVASIILQKIYNPSPKRLGCCITNQSYRPPAALFPNRFQSTAAIRGTVKNTIRAREAVEQCAEIEQTLSRSLAIEDFETLPSSAGRAISDSITMDSIEFMIKFQGRAEGLNKFYFERVFRPDCLAAVAGPLCDYLGSDMDCIDYSPEKYLERPWIIRAINNPMWIVENYVHSPLVNAFEILRCEALNLIGIQATIQEAFLETVEAGGWWVPFEKVCLASESPELLRLDGSARLHCDNGEAIRFRDGRKAWALDGVIVPERVVSKDYSINQIKEERNVEVRRIMIDRYGHSRYLKESGASVIHYDKFGILYEKRFNDDEPMKFVEVSNSTAEPDGSHRVYLLRVPPHMRTAREAVAWTFGLAAGEYEVEVET